MLAEKLKNISEMSNLFKEEIQGILGCTVTMDVKITVDTKLFEEQLFQSSITKVCSAIHHVKNISRAEMLNKSRLRKYCDARHLAFLLLKDDPFNMSLSKIGRAFNRDHSTVIAGCESISDTMQYDKFLESEYNEIKRILKQS